MTLESDSPFSSASSALIVIPIVMDLADSGARPDFKALQPWDLSHPTPVHLEKNGQKLPCFYDALTQEYWLFTIEGAVLLHKTAWIMLKKKQACRALDILGRYSLRNVMDAMVPLGLPKSSSSLIHDITILRNAFHDSIVVERNSGSSTFFTFWEDKTVRAGGILGPRYTAYLRPSLQGHKYSSMWHCGNNIIYCSACTSYRFPDSAASSATGSPDILVFGPPISLGRLTLASDISEMPFKRCLKGKRNRFNADGAYQVLSECFHKPTVVSIPIPRNFMVSNLLRDSLFVRKSLYGNRAPENWAQHFGDQIDDQQGMGMGTASGVGMGVAVGTRVAEVLLGA